MYVVRPFAQEIEHLQKRNCRLHSITSERIGNPELKAAIKCVHEYNKKLYLSCFNKKERRNLYEDCSCDGKNAASLRCSAATVHRGQQSERKAVDSFASRHFQRFANYN